MINPCDYMRKSTIKGAKGVGCHKDVVLPTITPRNVISMDAWKCKTERKEIQEA